MVRNFVFDMGNVLIYFKPDLFIERLGIRGDDAALLKEAVYLSPEWAELDAGSITEDEAVLIMKRRVPEWLFDAVEKLAAMWDRPILEVPGMYGLIRKLKEKGYGIYLLSNASLRQHDYWPRVPASVYFDGTLISADVKIVKPYRGIYEALFEKFDLVPSECLFIDDSADNIKAAEELGMRGFIFDDDTGKLSQYISDLCKTDLL